MAHEVLVVQPRRCAEERAQQKCRHIGVVAYMEALLMADEGEGEEGRQDECDTDPLPRVQPFAEEEQCAEQRPHGARGIDRRDERQRQVLDSHIGADPRGKDQTRLEEDKQMVPGRDLRHITERVRAEDPQPREDDEGQEQAGGAEDREQEHTRDRVAVQAALLAHIVATQAQSRQYGEDNPHAKGPSVRKAGAKLPQKMQICKWEVHF